MDVKKVSDTAIEITKEIVTSTIFEKQVYERDFIEKQIGILPLKEMR